MPASDDLKPKPDSEPATLVWRERAQEVPTAPEPGSVTLAGAALDKVNAHVRSAPELEQIGLLLGVRHIDDRGGVTVAIHDALALEASSTRVSVAMHGHAWRAAWPRLDAMHEADSIVGWYHSHPGHGIFLSATDLATHRRWFQAGAGVALVVDPQAGTLGCFTATCAIPMRHVPATGVGQLTEALPPAQAALNR